MTAISLWQPYATLIAIRAKRIETRNWKTAYTGPLAIHATATMNRESQEICREEPFRSVLKKLAPKSYEHTRIWNLGHGLPPLPLGCIVCTCRLVGCVRAEDILDLVTPFTSQERAFGDYGPLRFAWILEDVTPLDRPAPAKGQQGLWEWEPCNDG